MAPGIPALWEAVTEDDERARALLSDMYANTIRLDNAMLHLAHHNLQRGLSLVLTLLRAPLVYAAQAPDPVKHCEASRGVALLLATYAQQGHGQRADSRQDQP